jgi:hypothetical protein
MNMFKKLPNPKRLLLQALKQGWSVEGLSWATAWGFTVGIFPIYGVTTGTLAVIGWIGKLNHAVLQGFNYMVAPLKVMLILPYIAMGEILWMPDTRFTLSLSEFTRRFQEDPLITLQQFGMTFVHAVSAWLITFPFLMFGVYGITRFLFYLHQRVRYASRESMS